MNVATNPDLMSVLTGMQAAIQDIDAKLTAVQAELRSKPNGPIKTRESYTPEEVAGIVGKTEYTVREYCRLGRINASKREERRGSAAIWSIAPSEPARLKDEGLLLINQSRNAW